MLKRGAVLLLVGLMACDGAYRITVPYCPVSDTAWALADSVPLGCPGLDSTRARP